MNPVTVKRAVMILLSLSYFMLYAILLVILEPGVFVKILLLLVFAVIAHGLRLFLTIGTKDKPPRFTVIEVGTYCMTVPTMIFLLLGAFNFAEQRGTLLFTALTSFLTLFLDAFFDALAGRKIDPENDGKDDNDNNDDTKG